MFKPTCRFFDLYSRGKALPEEIDDYIGRWHSDETTDEPLHEYLGLTDDEFKAWVADSSLLPLILCARQENIPLELKVSERFKKQTAMAARGTADILVQRWLENRKKRESK